MFEPVRIEASQINPKIEYVVYKSRNGTILGERPVGQMYAAEEGGRRARAYVVGFDTHTNIGILVFADNDQDAIDAAADYVDDSYPKFFLHDADIGEYENAEGELEGIEHVGGHDCYVREDEITVFEVELPFEAPGE